MKNFKIKTILLGGVIALAGAAFGSDGAYAGAGISMSPMNQKILLEKGETYCGDFEVHNGATNTDDLSFAVSVGPFYVDESYEINYNNNGDYNKIVDWTTLKTTSGTVSPNQGKTIQFCVDVPEDAPAGGQYMAITVTSVNDDDTLEGGVNIDESYAMAHIVYAEVAGTTKRQGEITLMDAPGFLSSGYISATSIVKNTGNVHGTATYKLQVFPLFSEEEVYTNEESPEELTILPDRSRAQTSVWYDTPLIGIYNIVYTVEFEEVTNTLKKTVIVCPIWVLILIGAAILLVLYKLFAKKKE